MRSSTNYLLAKDDVGRPKTTTRTLPGHEHTFGYKEKPDPVGVSGCKSTFFIGSNHASILDQSSRVSNLVCIFLIRK